MSRVSERLRRFELPKLTIIEVGQAESRFVFASSYRLYDSVPITCWMIIAVALVFRTFAVMTKLWRVLSSPYKSWSSKYSLAECFTKLEYAADPEQNCAVRFEVRFGITPRPSLPSHKACPSRLVSAFECLWRVRILCSRNKEHQSDRDRRQRKKQLGVYI